MFNLLLLSKNHHCVSCSNYKLSSTFFITKCYFVWPIKNLDSSAADCLWGWLFNCHVISFYKSTFEFEALRYSNWEWEHMNSLISFHYAIRYTKEIKKWHNLLRILSLCVTSFFLMVFVKYCCNSISKYHKTEVVFTKYIENWFTSAGHFPSLVQYFQSCTICNNGIGV